MSRGRKPTTVYKTPTGDIIDSCYCRRCQRDLSPREFYEATDEVLDTNGYMSVCKDCVSDLFSEAFKLEKSLELAILKMCRMLNVAYVPEAIDALRTWIDNKIKSNSDYSSGFGFYKSKVGVFVKFNASQQKHFTEPSPEIFKDINDMDDIGDENYDLVEFWGEGLVLEDYEFLESELANFKKTHKSDTYSELVLLKEVCFVLLDIKKARQSNKSTASHVKALQEIMKSLAISPNMANASGANKSMEAFGLWVKDIEDLEPAEWHEDHELFKDMDDIEGYIDKYFVRPIRNFITGSRDFTITEGDDGEEITFDNSEYDDLEED